MFLSSTTYLDLIFNILNLSLKTPYENDKFKELISRKFQIQKIL